MSRRVAIKLTAPLSHHVAALMMASVPADDVHSSIGIGMATNVMPAAMMATEAPH